MVLVLEALAESLSQARGLAPFQAPLVSHTPCVHYTRHRGHPSVLEEP